MPKWSKDETEFEVNVHYNDEKGSQVRIPKPLLGKLGHPEKVKFILVGKSVKVVPINKQNIITMKRKLKEKKK